MRHRILTRGLAAAFLAFQAGSFTVNAGEPPPLDGVARMVFLGDSITYAGGYIDFLESFLRTRYPALRCEFLNLGLPSETVSGLSEPGHAGGDFPRPVLRERLDRVLSKTKPDLIVACYGMNDGIYYPFDEARLVKFQEGMKHLREQAARSGAKILHVTPPVFDPLPIKARTLPPGLAEYRQPFEGYDQVLERYSAWLLSQRDQGWDVVDLHGPMARYLAAERKRDPQFRLADDGVHTSAAGHWIIAREILLHWGIPASEIGGTSSGMAVLRTLPHGLEVLDLVGRRQALLKDSWLTATGHRRPGMSPGIPLPEAQHRAQEFEEKIRRLEADAPQK